ncbi:MAG: hypothetical protein QE484_17035 [Rhizobium sp.]|nr:hypothetical protein [Rhizobium sp.]
MSNSFFMNTPAELREKKIKAAEKARSLIDGLGKSHDLDARATMLHDRVSEGIKTICAQNQGFDQRQTEILTEIAVHLALLFDGELKPPTGFWRRLKAEFSGMSPVGKLGLIAVAITIAVGVAQIGSGVYSLGYSWFMEVKPAEAQSTSRSPGPDKDALSTGIEQERGSEGARQP